MLNLFVVMDPSEKPFDVSSKAGNMYLNRFCIDEDAACDLSGINYFKKSTILEDKGKVFLFTNRIYLTDIFKVYGILGFHLKERFDEKIIDSCLLKLTQSKANECKTHFLIASGYYYYQEDKLKKIISKGMKKYKIKTVMITIISMTRVGLITKWEMEKYCKGEHYVKVSVNEDFDSLFEDLQLGTQLQNDTNTIHSYFLPKLTEEELDHLKRNDRIYLETFINMPVYRYQYRCIFTGKYKWSQPDSEFVQGECRRRTFTIENSSLYNGTPSHEVSSISDISFDID